jgi:hypothetical protein
MSMVVFSNQKIVEFTFEKRRGEVEQRVYSFDTIQDQQVKISKYFYD